MYEQVNQQPYRVASKTDYSLQTAGYFYTGINR